MLTIVHSGCSKRLQTFKVIDFWNLEVHSLFDANGFNLVFQPGWRLKKMAKSKRAANSKELKAVLARVKTSALSSADKATVSDLLSQSIKLRQLLEKSGASSGGKRVLASLPFGFDLVK